MESCWKLPNNCSEPSDASQTHKELSTLHLHACKLQTQRHQKTKSTINPGGIQPLVPSQSICPSTSSVAWGGSLTFRMGRSLWHFTKQILSAEDAEFEDIRPSMAVLFVPSNNPLLLLFRTEAPQQGFVIKIHRSRKRQNGSPERDLF